MRGAHVARLQRTLMECIEHGRVESAVDVALEHLRAGVAHEEVITALGALQEEVGQRWLRNEWTVAQEHAATAVVDHVLAAVAGTINELAPYPPVLVVCAEGDWHSLAARMLTALLRAQRWDARFLGGSFPADRLRPYLDEERPCAVAVHCSSAFTLPGALATLAVAHAADVPVLVGGRGFGISDVRAAAIGADGWALDGSTADMLLHRWVTEGPPPPREPDAVAVARCVALHAVRTLVVDAVADDELAVETPQSRTVPEAPRRRTREDLTYMVGFVEAAVLTGDLTILQDYLRWLADFLEAGSAPSSVVASTVHSVVASLRRLGHGPAADMLTEAATATV